MTDFDVFLSHNSKDKPIVRRLSAALEQRGLKPWLDEDQLVPGRPWQKALEDIVRITRTAAVLFGPAGMGPWEEPEMRACLTEFVNRKLPIIPVLLPDAPSEPELPLFLRAFTWVDLRDGLTKDGLDKLEWGITEQKPHATGPETRQPTDVERLASDVATARQGVELSRSVVLELLHDACAQQRSKYLELADTFRWSELEAEVRTADRQLVKAVHEPIPSTADQFAIECVAQLFKICTQVVREDSTISLGAIC